MSQFAFSLISFLNEGEYKIYSCEYVGWQWIHYRASFETNMLIWNRKAHGNIKFLGGI